MLLDYSPSYHRVNKHRTIEENDLLYVAILDETGEAHTRTVQILDMRKEFNPLYGNSTKQQKKFFDPEFQAALVSYGHKNLLDKILGRLTPSLSEPFWVDNAFFQPTRKDAVAAMLTFVKSERARMAKMKFELQYPGYLDEFKEHSNRDFCQNPHAILRHFFSKQEEEDKRKKQERILQDAQGL